MSASIGLDDPTVWDRTAVYNLGIPSAIGANGTGSNAYAGTHAPDIVGNIRVDQAWGLFQLSAAAHEVSGVLQHARSPARVPTALSEISGHPDTKWGGSVMAALQIKNIPTGAGDDIKIDATYAKGATKNVIATSGDLAELCDVRRQRLRPTRASASARPPTASICPAQPAPAASP